MKKPIVSTYILLLLILSACSRSILPGPTSVPTSTFTAVPSFTATQAPVDTALVSTQTSEWNGIPIMPNAIAGEGDEESYVFTVKATPQQVQEYYQLELGKLGWQLLGVKDSSLIFMDKDSATLTVSIIAKGDQVLVLLVK